MRKLLTILVVLFVGTTSHAQTITLGDINHDGLVIHAAFLECVRRQYVVRQFGRHGQKQLLPLQWSMRPPGFPIKSAGK